MVTFGEGVGGGGGGGGLVTLTVAEPVVLPPGPVAVRVYVVESVGKTRRFPEFCTVPMALSIDTLVTLPLTSQRSVADCPRWMEVGSTLNCEMVGAAGFGGAGVGAGAGGGGGGGGGAFFLQPAANIASDRAIQRTVNFRLYDMNIAS
jgi:hypothetical protein